jgi:hypothetical protein
MAKDFAGINRMEAEAGLQAPGAEVTTSTKQDITSRFVAMWEKKNAQRALRGGTVSTMALTLAACGGDDDDPVAVTTTIRSPRPSRPHLSWTSWKTPVCISWQAMSTASRCWTTPCRKSRSAMKSRTTRSRQRWTRAALAPARSCSTSWTRTTR